MNSRMTMNFSNAAVQYDMHASYQHTQTARVFEAAKACLPQGVQLLDLGCGTGYFAHLAHKAEQHWKITGLDIAYGMCLQAVRRCGVIQADAQALPVASSSMDAVVSSLCLQWVGSLPMAMMEIARILKPGGVAIIATLGAGSLPELHAAIAASGSGVRVRKLPAEKMYRDAIAATGLKTVEYRQTHTVEQYGNLRELLDSMRRIGASDADDTPRQPVRWKALSAAYAGQNATWEEQFMVLGKK